jgi:hypothetical protein
MLQPQKTQKKGAICGFIVHDVSYGAVAATLNGLGPFESCEEWNHITSIELGNKFLERSPSFFLLHHNSMLDAFPYDSYYSTHLAFFHGHFLPFRFSQQSVRLGRTRRPLSDVA